MATKKTGGISRVQIKEAIRAEVAEMIDSQAFLDKLVAFAPRGADEESAQVSAGYVLLQLLASIGYGSDLVVAEENDGAEVAK